MIRWSFSLSTRVPKVPGGKSSCTDFARASKVVGPELAKKRVVGKKTIEEEKEKIMNSHRNTGLAVKQEQGAALALVLVLAHQDPGDSLCLVSEARDLLGDGFRPAGSSVKGGGRLEIFVGIEGWLVSGVDASQRGVGSERGGRVGQRSALRKKEERRGFEVRQARDRRFVKKNSPNLILGVFFQRESIGDAQGPQSPTSP